ncbi:MAG: PIN domain-containing protein [Myxococcaceae bacterium]|nr:PIN domain-containing protein [Myxococcaceae bacterium]
MAEPRYLVDTSVWLRAGQDVVQARLERLMIAGKIFSCRVVDLEVTYSARTRLVAEAVAERVAWPEVELRPSMFDRALEVMALLAGRGLHRGAKPVDLIIAAAAEARGLCVLHYDGDYDRIARVTGQPMEWVAPRGTLDR